MAHEKHEVGTKLTLDDEASEALHKVAEGFEKVKEHVHEAAHELAEMAKQAVAFTIGFQLEGAIESMKEFGHELVEGAVHLENQKKELTGLLSITEKGEASLEDLADKADELNEKFEGLAMTTGNTKEQMLDAFEMIASRSQRSSEEISGMVEKMAEASKRLPGGMDAMAGAWRDLEAGFIKPKNALVMLMRQTGVATGSAKSIAKGLTGMMQDGRQEEVFKLAEAAIDKMASKMKDVPLTFGQMLQSMKGMRESLFETMGTPMIRVLGPQLQHLQQYMVEHREEITKLAETLGERVGEWVKEAAVKVEEGFEYLKTHADEILDALEKGGQALKDAISFMVEHRTLLLALAGAYYGQKGLGAIAGALPVIGTVGGQLAGAGMRAAAGVAGGAGASSAAGAFGVGASMAMLGAADVLIWKEAAKQAGELEKESGLSWTQAAKHVVFGWTGAHSTLTEASDRALNFKASLDAWNKTVTDGTHHSVKELEGMSKKIHEFAEMMVWDGDMTADAARKIEESMDQRLRAERSHQEHLDALSYSSMEVAQMVAQFGPQSMAKTYADAFRAASQEDAKAALESARTILDANSALRDALAGTGANVEKALARLQKLAGTDGSGAKLPAINFGPTTMNIHQDFRNVDPDRVAIVFRKDVSKHAVSRVSSRTGQPFGI
jgi:hypothetical protein